MRIVCLLSRPLVVQEEITTNMLHHSIQHISNDDAVETLTGVYFIAFFHIVCSWLYVVQTLLYEFERTRTLAR